MPVVVLTRMLPPLRLSLDVDYCFLVACFIISLMAVLPTELCCWPSCNWVRTWVWLAMLMICCICCCCCWSSRLRISSWVCFRLMEEVIVLESKVGRRLPGTMCFTKHAISSSLDISGKALMPEVEALMSLFSNRFVASEANSYRIRALRSTLMLGSARIFRCSIFSSVIHLSWSSRFCIFYLKRVRSESNVFEMRFLRVYSRSKIFYLTSLNIALRVSLLSLATVSTNSRWLLIWIIWCSSSSFLSRAIFNASSNWSFCF